MFRRKKNRPILKSPGEIEAMREAGRVSALVLECLADLVAPGVSTLELDEFAEELIRSEGGTPAFKGYGGFPASICASVNDVVVHGIPSAETILCDGDVLSVDTGAVVDGWVGDNAFTYEVGSVSKRRHALCEATQEAMWAGVNAAWPGKRLGDVGAAVDAVARERGMGNVSDYGGHGIGRKMHEPPHVPNFGRAGKGMVLKPGLVIAIEPMFTLGGPSVHVLRDGWAVATNDRSAAAHFEKTVAVTEDGPVVLTTV